ncbi:LPS export ABC transporter periplasmic protein LptC [Verrucomicrobiales bacterium BCK34]|nr:LPS export ABC transporter periplasmic protein LptC [Verrucomicrobiales bacterium BCK34]
MLSPLHRSAPIRSLFAAGILLCSIAMANEPVPGSLVQSMLPPELTKLFPIGRVFKGVAIPSYTDDRLKSVMRAVTVVRVDEQYLDLTNLVISIYNDEGEPETYISMDEAVFDLVTQQLVSKTPSKIEQEKFTMTGDKMTFETQTRLSRMEGNVRVIIPDAKDFTSQMGLAVPGGK